jgi:CheY-like chemotaxis protein
MLAAGIAHDLNNVLAPVLMGAPLLRSRMVSPGDLQVLESIESSAGRGAALVRQILSFAHGAGGSKVLIQVRHLIRDISDLVTQTFPKSIQLDELVANNLWPLQGNPTQLHQVVLNLCVNARDAMPNGGVLRLHAANRRVEPDEAKSLGDGRPGNFVVIEIGDTGTGIPADVLPRIWEPFFTTKGEGKGTGLGLATVRGIATSHNGFVTLETAEGKGTTFRVFLPAVEQENQAQKGAAGSAHPFLARGQGELVLVVDDEPTIRDLVVMILSRFGYRVLTAANDREAMEHYTPRMAEIALVITDLGMPGLGGAKMAANLKQMNPNVRLLFISGGELSIGGDPAPAGSVMLAKPFTGEDLLTHVHRVLNAPV